MERNIHQMLEQYAKSHPIRMHMPGNKGKQYAHDTTELAQTDDLACPAGAIRTANQAIAQVYGMPWASMSTCGATACVHAMLHAAKGKLLIGRNAHKSVINGVFMFGLSADFFADTGTKGTLAAIEQSDAKALFLTTPDYAGRMINLEAVCKAARDKGMQIFCDCAHGAHFPFSRRFPELPTQADAYCVSAHKTLPLALTQGAILLGKEDLTRELFLTHTTSPSFLILESIEAAVAWMREENLEPWLELCEQVRAELGSTYRLIGEDCSRFVLSLPGYSGFELLEHYAQSNVIGEMATRDYAVFITSPADQEGIRKFARVAPPPRREGAPGGKPTGVWAEPGVARSELLGQPTEWILLQEAEGRICAHALGLYPPGVANALPGERITQSVIQYLLQGNVFGMREGKVEVTK